jgi:hypothetical protein
MQIGTVDLFDPIAFSLVGHRAVLRPLLRFLIHGQSSLPRWHISFFRGPGQLTLVIANAFARLLHPK